MPLGRPHRHHQRGQPAGQLHRKHGLSVVCPGVRPDRRRAMEACHLWPRRFELVLLQQMGRALRPRSHQGAAENGAAGVRPTSRRRALRRPPLLASVKTERVKNPPRCVSGVDQPTCESCKPCFVGLHRQQGCREHRPRYRQLSDSLRPCSAIDQTYFQSSPFPCSSGLRAVKSHGALPQFFWRFACPAFSLIAGHPYRLQSAKPRFSSSSSSVTVSSLPAL